MKKFKKFNSNENFGDRTKESNQTENKIEYCVYIGNLNSGNLENNDINKLLNQFLNSSPNAKNVKINSIKVLKECIYIYFDSKNNALNAVKFFNNYTFKNFKFEVFLIDSIDSKEKSVNQDEDENYEYDCKNIFWTDSIECEILVSNRLIKKYADTINERLQKSFFSLNTFIKYSNNDANQEQTLTKEIIRDAFNRNLLYLITINQSNEKYNSLNLIIFNKWRLLKSPKITHVIKENKSIPSNKAFDIIRSDYRDYLDNIKDIYLKSNQELLVEKTDPICNESETKNNQCFDKKLFESVLKKMRNVSEIGYEDIDFLTSFLNNQKTKLLTNSKINSQADKTINKNEFSNSNSIMTQANQSTNQNIPAMMQQQKIPCLLSQPVFYPNPHLQQQINLVPPVPNQANSSNQIPALMSLQNQTKMMYQARVPSLMGLRPNFRSPGQNNNFHFNKRH